MNVVFYLVVVFICVLASYYYVYGCCQPSEIEDEDVLMIVLILSSLFWPFTIPLLIFVLFVAGFHMGMKKLMFNMRENRKNRKKET